MEKEKKCKNCKFFNRHYVHSDTSFQKLAHGHCMNDEIPWKVRKHDMPYNNVCEKWESDEDKKKERKDNIISVLEYMRNTLSNIEIIIKDDLNPD